MGVTNGTGRGPVEVLVKDTRITLDGPIQDRKTAFHRHYHLIKKLGTGSFASVYAAKASGDEGGVKESAVAVKVIDIQGRDNKHTEYLKSQTMKELDLMKLVRGSSHVVRLHEAFFEDGLVYAVMDKCDLSLICFLEWMPTVTERTLAAMMKQMLEALQSIHRAGVIHRDIKPDNWLCMRDATVKLCDFGLSEVLHRGQKGVRGVNGTAPFMSPEMLRNVLYTHKTDVWSLGVIAYIMLRAQFPYKPKVRTAAAMKEAILAGKPEPSFKDGDLPEGLAKHSAEASLFLCSLLKRDPSRRPHAGQALQSKWIMKVASTPSPNAGSFRPTILMGKSIGAFDRAQNKVHQQTELDAYLHEAQKAHHRTKKVFVEHNRSKESTSPSLTNSTNSGCSSRACSSPASSIHSRPSTAFSKSIQDFE